MHYRRELLISFLIGLVLCIPDLSMAQQEVPIDIKPQSCPNPLEVKGRGVLPVAILGTTDFDVTQVNLGSITLEGVPPSRATFNDTATPFDPFLGKEPTYFNDFDGGLLVAPGVTASLGGIVTTESVQGYAGLGPGGNTFGGDFLRNTTGGDAGDPGPPGSATTLTLSGLPPHTSIDINFLLAIIDSWDGSLPGQPPPDGCDICHPDVFTVTVDGNTVFAESFGFNGPTFMPPAGVLLIEFTPLGFNPDFGDAAYDMSLNPTFDEIPHTSSTLTIEWFASGEGWQGATVEFPDESWAIENVEIVLNDCSDCTGEGPDGFVDLVMQFDAQAVVDALDAVTDRECLALELIAELQDGTPIVGEDVVIILKKGKQ